MVSYQLNKTQSDDTMIEQNVKKILSGIPETNPFGESITVVGATKTRSIQEINRAITAGIKNVGENRAQEFRDKVPYLLPCNYHFFGRLQTNKVKYLIGKAYLIQSVDSVKLATEISNQSQKAGVKTNVLLEVNCGEKQKGGIPFEEVLSHYKVIKDMPNVVIQGLMAVLPENDEQIKNSCLQMRELYDIIRKTDENFKFLSMGMSNDYVKAVQFGSNMVRIGTAIFGERNYKER